PNRECREMCAAFDPARPCGPKRLQHGAGKWEGEQIGEQRGELKGEQKGEAKILTRLLQRSFGNLPAWANEKIAKAEPSSLEEWSLRIFDAQSLDDVFSDKV
ncbi:MAG: DUF4351 domain-containing protein, partial [Magnetococcales bacterium]|nr:DUF4351 domain-containing protein [Magnetococcales bacterium]